MLRTPNLDDQNFAQIVEEAVKSIPYIYPEWTDHNAHDPGVTMLELFAWYKEMQQYHLNCSTQRAMDMYLKLLGMQRQDIRPARAVIAFSGLEEPIAIRAGDEMDIAGGATFTFEQDACVGGDKVCALAVEQQGGLTDLTELVLRDRMRVRVFREPGAVLWIGVRRVQESGTLALLVEIDDSYPVPRNAFAPGEKPGRALRFTGADGAELAVRCDETHAFCQTGKLELDVRGQVESDPLGMGSLLWVRVEQTAPGCEEDPQLVGVSAAFAPARQIKTLVRHRDGRADGRQISLSRESLLERNGRCFLLARDGYGWRTVPSVRYFPDRVEATLDFDPVQDGKDNLRAIFYEEWMAPHLTADGEGRSGFAWPMPLGQQLPDVGSLGVMGLARTPGGMRYVNWRYALSLEALTPFDRCYACDPEAGALVFGDNLRGEVAPSGPDALILTDFSLTLADQGRFPVVKTLEMNGHPLSARAVVFEEGCARESTPAVRARLMRRLQSVARAVTESDFAQIARRTPGLRVMQAGAIAGYDPDRPQGGTGCVTVVTLPYSQQPRPLPDADFLSKVQAQMEDVRPVCTRVKVVAPLYVRIHVSVTLLTAAGATGVEAAVRAALETCFKSDETGWKLGARITETEIAGVIGQVQGVLGVKTLMMTADSARAGRSAAGDILLPPHALPMLGALEVYR